MLHGKSCQEKASPDVRDGDEGWSMALVARTIARHGKRKKYLPVGVKALVETRQGSMAITIHGPRPLDFAAVFRGDPSGTRTHNSLIKKPQIAVPSPSTPIHFPWRDAENSVCPSVGFALLLPVRIHACLQPRLHGIRPA